MPAEVTRHISEYEKLRAKNIEENKKMLESLGLLRAFKPILEPIKKRRITPKVLPPVKRTFEETKIKYRPPLEEIIGNRIRRSLRVKGVEPDGSLTLPPEEDEEEEQKSRTPKIKRDNFFGAIDGVPVGTHWETRIQCSADGVHRPTVAGIHGNETLGCYSLALSGGYEDDVDLGESFTYTGAGGRDLKGTPLKPKNLRVASQSKDQVLQKVNLALSLNVENRQPVRVIRGYKCPSAFAPEYGYRYDGLYSVEKYWSSVGLSGYVVWKFILKRLSDQSPPPWKESLHDIKEEDADESKYAQDMKGEEKENCSENGDKEKDTETEDKENGSENNEQEVERKIKRLKEEV